MLGESFEIITKHYIVRNMRKMSLQSFRDGYGWKPKELNIIAYLLIHEVPDFALNIVNETSELKMEQLRK